MLGVMVRWKKKKDSKQKKLILLFFLELVIDLSNVFIKIGKQKNQQHKKIKINKKTGPVLKIYIDYVNNYGNSITTFEKYKLQPNFVQFCDVKKKKL